MISQVLQFFDAHALALFGEIETAAYAALRLLGNLFAEPNSPINLWPILADGSHPPTTELAQVKAYRA